MNNGSVRRRPVSVFTVVTRRAGPDVDEAKVVMFPRSY